MRDAANHVQRTVIHEETLPCDVPLDELDMDWLRRQFLTLFDRAALAVCRAGYDLDDVVFDRFICRYDGDSEMTGVPLPSLTDASAVANAIVGAPGTRARDAAQLVKPPIVGLRVVVVLERW